MRDGLYVILDVIIIDVVSWYCLDGMAVFGQLSCVLPMAELRCNLQIAKQVFNYLPKDVLLC